MHEIFNDGVMRATITPDKWVVVEWLTDTVGYLSKQVVKDLYRLEQFIKQKHLKGWMLGSEVENEDMHKLIEKFGGQYHSTFEGYKIYRKQVGI